jgi:hypothetical protein
VKGWQRRGVRRPSRAIRSHTRTPAKPERESEVEGGKGGEEGGGA